MSNQEDRNKAFARWLARKLLEWQTAQVDAGHRKPNQSAFADHLGIKQYMLSGWMSGNRGLPDEDGMAQLAQTFGAEVYEATGRKVPSTGDERLDRVNARWAKLPERVKTYVDNYVDKAARRSETPASQDDGELSPA